MSEPMSADPIVNQRLEIVKQRLARMARPRKVREAAEQLVLNELASPYATRRFLQFHSKSKNIKVLLKIIRHQNVWGELLHEMSQVSRVAPEVRRAILLSHHVQRRTVNQFANDPRCATVVQKLEEVLR